MQYKYDCGNRLLIIVSTAKANVGLTPLTRSREQ